MWDQIMCSFCFLPFPFGARVELQGCSEDLESLTFFVHQ